MQKLVIAVLLVFSLVVMDVTCQDAMLAPPDRPSEFRSPDQLRQYLKALNEYYAIVGRPRFGRSVNKRSVNDAVFGEATKTGLDRDIKSFFGNPSYVSHIKSYMKHERGSEQD